MGKTTLLDHLGVAFSGSMIVCNLPGLGLKNLIVHSAELIKEEEEFYVCGNGSVVDQSGLNYEGTRDYKISLKQIYEQTCANCIGDFFRRVQYSKQTQPKCTEEKGALRTRPCGSAGINYIDTGDGFLRTGKSSNKKD